MRRGSPALSVGRLTQVQTGGATTRSITQYDALGRILADSQTADGNTYPFSYAYNLLGKLTSMTYPSLRVVKTWYDPAGRTCVVGGTTCTATNGFAGSTSYAENGALEQVTLGNGLVETTTFNNRFQPTALTAATGSQLLNLTFGYPASGSNNGNVVSENVVTAGGLNAQQVFTYDAFNRLLVASENPANATSPVCPDAASAWCQSFGYDQFGNRAVTAYGPQTGTFLNPNWTPSSATQFNGGNQWTRGLGDAYDAAGNLLSLASNSSPGTAASVFSYDGENRMTASNVMNTGGVQYVYDGSGQRVEKIAGGTKTVYVYDAQGQLAAEYSTAVNTARATEYLTTDPLGSTRLVTSATGGVVKRYDYVPFGEEVSVGIGGRAAGDGYGSGTYPNTPDVVSEKFTGKERDPESGLDYFGTRYYGAPLGRFTSPDEPLVDQEKYDPQSWNLYAYVRNNPLRSVDPDGRACDFAKGPNGENIITDRDGKGCDELHDNTVHGDEPGLLMLAGIAEVLTDPHNVAQFVSDAGRATASLIAPQASATAECIFPGGDCDTTNLALAALPATGVTRFVKNRKLRNILAAFNRTGKGVGTGSTADAIRQELQTGMAVGGKYHYQKGVELRDALLNVLKSPGPDPSDRAVAKEALKDIQEAISRK